MAMSYTEKEDQFLVDNCINGDMTYGEAAKKLGRPSAKTIGARIARLKEIHNFKKNTLQKNQVKKTEPESVEFCVTVNETDECDNKTSAFENETPISANETAEKPAIPHPTFSKKEFDDLLVEIATQPQPLPDLDELESIPYVAVPTDNSFGEAVNIASALADMFCDDIGYFHFNKDSDSFTIEIGSKRISISEVSDNEQ